MECVIHKNPVVAGSGATLCSLCLSSLVLVGLSGAPPNPPRPAEPIESAPTFRATATVEDVMVSIIDPAADAVWDAVVTVVNADGIATTQPETSEDWSALRRHAITLVEATNLLLVDGRRVAGAGSRSELPGIDLEPAEIESLLAEDHETWARLVGQLHGAGVGVLNAVDAADVDALLVAGDRLDLACENCHARFWYPGYGGRPDESP